MKQGPEWLSLEENWLLIISTFPPKETESDVELDKKIFLVATEATEKRIVDGSIISLMHRFKYNSSG